jgi:hypothetical protein
MRICLQGVDAEKNFKELQDRRSPGRAAFLFADGSSTVECFLTVGSEGRTSVEGAGSSDADPPLGKLEITRLANGPGITLVRGSVPPDSATVRILLADGTEVFASVGLGRFLAWWPDSRRPMRIQAIAATGETISEIDGLVRDE